MERGKQIQNAIVEIIVNNEPSCTGWFFNETKPYILTVGHSFSNHNDSIEIRYNGKKFHAELLEYKDDNDLLGLDYAILLVRGIKNYSVLITKFNLHPNLPKKMISYGFPKSAIGKLHLEGKIQNYVQRNDKEESSNTPIYLLKTDKRINLDGHSGSPICIKNGKRWIAIGIFNMQYKKGLTGERVAYALDLKALNSSSKLSKIKSETKKLLEKHNIFGHPNNNELQRDRIGLMIKPYRKDNSEGVEKFHKIDRDWKKIEKLVLEKIQQIIPTYSKNDLIHFRSFPMNFRNKGSVKNGLMFYENDQAITRVVLDFSNQFNFKEQISSTSSHLIGVRFAEKMELSSTEIYNLIVTLKSSGSFDTTKGSLFHLLEDILMDINIFYSIPTLSYLFNSPALKKNFNNYKIDYARKHGYKSYGLDLAENMAYVSMSSLVRKKIDDKLNIKDLKEVWLKFVIDYLPTHLDINSVIGQIGSQLTYSNFSNQDEIVTYIKKLPKLGGQFSIEKIERRLGKFTHHSLVIFAFIKKKPNKKSQEKSLEALFTDGKISGKTFQFFELKQIKQVLASKDFLSIIIFRKPAI